jgi:large subunit ribosomal protein L6
MSRIGKQPIVIPADVKVSIDAQKTTVSGKLGELTQSHVDGIKVTLTDDRLIVERASDARQHRSLHGLMRSLLQNMVIGVSQGYSKTLQMSGVGYRSQVLGNKLVVHAGYSHPVDVIAPPGITFKVNNETEIVVSGFDKQMVGQVSSSIRTIRKPEPYKGKGIKYQNEVIRRKQGKTA